MILITGAAGFIASNVVSKFNAEGRSDIILCDNFVNTSKLLNWTGKQYACCVDRDMLFNWVNNNKVDIEAVVHLGARTDTTEQRWSVFEKLNLSYSKAIWTLCCERNIPLVYASSAATYGAGEHGYRDSHEAVEALKPLNPYGCSKNEFDKWVLQQCANNNKPPHWYGLKFFNVYGPNEYHKGRMASVVLHSYRSICEHGKVSLFRSHRVDFADGMQKRDFVYVKDVAKVISFLLQRAPSNGLYNVGTGKAQSFLDLANATFFSMNRQPNIEFIDIPLDIRDKYQYFTEADMTKLRSAGYAEPFATLEEGVGDYVTNYLQKGMHT